MKTTGLSAKLNNIHLIFILNPITDRWLDLFDPTNLKYFGPPKNNFHHLKLFFWSGNVKSSGKRLKQKSNLANLFTVYLTSIQVYLNIGQGNKTKINISSWNLK